LQTPLGAGRNLLGAISAVSSLQSPCYLPAISLQQSLGTGARLDEARGAEVVEVRAERGE